MQFGGIDMEISLQELISRIQKADDIEINEMMGAIRQRYQKLFPDWEIIYLAFPKKDPAARQVLLDYLTRMISE